MFKKTYLVDDTPGSISNIYEIKILICRILNEFKGKITKDQLCTVLQFNETVNYFNSCQAIEELLTSNQIYKKTDKGGETQILLTKQGKEIATTLKTNISKNLISKTIKDIKNFLKEERENKNKKIYLYTKDDGYIVKLVLEETQSNIMDLELYCPTNKIATKFKKEMKNKTAEIYKSIIAIINNEYDVLLNICKNLKEKQNK